MTSWHDFFIGLFIGLGVAAIVWIIYIFKVCSTRKKGESEVKKYKEMLTSRMEIESEGVEKLKKSNEELKSQNENLRISLQTMSQKPGRKEIERLQVYQKAGRKEIERLQVYQKAVDRLTINSPGFGPAWQAALKESEEEFSKTYSGVLPFIRRVIPGKTNAQLMEAEDVTSSEE